MHVRPLVIGFFNRIGRNNGDDDDEDEDEGNNRIGERWIDNTITILFLDDYFRNIQVLV